MELLSTKSSKIIKGFMSDPEIWEKIGTDAINIDEFEPVVPENVIIMVAKAENTLIGMHQFTMHTDRVLCHPILLKKYRLKHGRRFLKAGIKWFFQNTCYDTLEAEIPVNHLSTINLAVHLNFKKVGIVKNGVLKDDEKLDLQILRLAR